MTNPTERFTQTVQDYVNYRPSYPNEMLQLLISACDLSKDKVIADVGSGTGLLAKILLDHGDLVYGIEPNKAMREAGETFLQAYPRFKSIDGTAEATTLADHGVDIITAGTAFHWFDVEKTKTEFQRILTKDGWVFLVWNVRDKNSALIQDFENVVLEYCPDYKKSDAFKFDKTVGKEFFSPNKMHTASFKNSQQFDWQGFRGRLLSVSYSLRPGDDRYEDMLAALKEIYKRYQKNNAINFSYETKAYYGHL